MIFIYVQRAISNKKLKFAVVNGLGNYVIDKNKKTDIETIDIENITTDEFFKTYTMKFNVLIADCEGCLLSFINENIYLLQQLDLIIFEKDNEINCNYDDVADILQKHNYIKIDDVLNNFQQVWIVNK